MGPDIGSTPNPDTGVQYQYTSAPPATGPVESPSTPGQVGYVQSQSTLSPSQAEELMRLFLAMQIPFLAPPIEAGGRNGVDGIDVTTAVKWVEAQYDKIKNDIIDTIWNQFSKSLEELREFAKNKEIQRERDVTKEGPMSPSENLLFLMALSVAEREKELDPSGSGDKSVLEAQFKPVFDHWFRNTGMVNPGDGTYPDPSFVTGTLTSQSDIIRSVLGGALAVAGIEGMRDMGSIQPLADAAVATGLPMDTQGAIAMLTALMFLKSGQNKAAIETVDDGVKKGMPPQNLDFAMNFARNIVAIVTPKLDESGLAPQQREQNQNIRLMLSVIALNLLYRQTFGGMEGSKEFTGLLDPKSIVTMLNKLDIDPSLKAQLQTNFNSLVANIQANLPADVDARADMIARLSDYIDSKDSVDSMLSTTTMLAASLGVDPDIMYQRISGTTT